MGRIEVRCLDLKVREQSVKKKTIRKQADVRLKR
jgi:hypothetical protein